MTKIAVIRCETVSEVCPGTGCFKAFNNRTVQFKDYGQQTEMIGFFTCGGCSGRRVYRLAKKLKTNGADKVHISSCMLTKKYPSCPNIDSIKISIEAAGLDVVEGTHH
ncbi:CGGC domain-containing protein [Methanosalsum natronophilum]|uniref:CGGC domain-containing protein n=1 Tax=Methanosalsum natronophilum TaxID=768733 RepID=A0A424YUH2_9EURY|nr:CGGC domain-containing protein [Methanosalsum natronophilum]RQD82623.1 MAG: CGGC domain-containing protein [Methanosalsum natronophilum]